MAEALPELPAGAFDKLDTGDDGDFYAPPRLVTHIDEGAVAALTAYYREILPPGGAVLDRCPAGSAIFRPSSGSARWSATA